jgi:hypothetical protein
MIPSWWNLSRQASICTYWPVLARARCRFAGAFNVFSDLRVSLDALCFALHQCDVCTVFFDLSSHDGASNSALKAFDASELRIAARRCHFAIRVGRVTSAASLDSMSRF